MDPNECLASLIYAFGKREFDDVFEHASNLVDWLERGGFAPNNSALEHPEYRRDVLGFARMAKRLAKASIESR